MNNLFLIGGAVVAYLLMKKKTSAISATGVPLTKHEKLVNKIETTAVKQGIEITPAKAEAVAVAIENVSDKVSDLNKKIVSAMRKAVSVRGIHGLNEYTE